MAHTLHQTKLSGPHAATGAQSASFDTNPTAGRSVILLLWGYSPGGGFNPTLSDNQGNTYTKENSPLVSGSTIRCVIAYSHNITASGTFTVTVTPGAGSYYSFSLLEVSGLDTAGHDQVATNSDDASGSATPNTGTTGTTAVAEELAVAIVVHAATLTSNTVNVSWTQVQEELNSLSQQGGESDRRDLSATGTYSCDWTFDTTSKYSAIIVTFADAGPNFNAQGTGAFDVVGAAHNQGSFAASGQATFAATGTYVPPVGFDARGEATFIVSSIVSISASFAAKGDAQFRVTPNSPGVSASFHAHGESGFYVTTEPQTAPPSLLAPYGGLST